MPICPGCERKVPYDQLDLHQRYCDGIGDDARSGTASMERLDRRLTSLESRVETRLREIEADLERQLSRAERARQDAETPGRPE